MMSSPLDVTIITGMSGAGRSEAAHVLEDLGFFVIDNLPPMLIGKVAELARGGGKPLKYALVVDVRSGDFLHDLSTAIDELHRYGARTRVLFLDAADEVLVRRYEASRRRHPLSDTERVSDGIARERALLESLKGEADLIVDTSSLNVHELRDRLRELFAEHTTDSAMQVNLVSFGYKHGLPIDVDVVFDCRFLPNPHWVEELRPLTGLDAPVRELRALATGHERVSRRARPAPRDDAARLRTRREGLPLDRGRLHRRPAPQRRRRRTARRAAPPARLPRGRAPPRHRSRELRWRRELPRSAAGTDLPSRSARSGSTRATSPRS